MHLETCKSCGGVLERTGNYYACKHCGNKWMIDADNDVHVVERANAWSALRKCEFEQAYEHFAEIIRKEPENHEAYWGQALANAGIIYVNDFDANKKIPTCNSISEVSFLNSEEVQKAISFAPQDIAISYRQQAEKIEAIRVEWINKASREPAYDIFISYKDTVREGDTTVKADRDEAYELYNHLTQLGYKVFFSHISLKGKGSEFFEPYIYNAIRTAKVMIVYGTNPEYFDSIWIKNEWSRFRKYISNGVKKSNSLIVVCSGFPADKLPLGLRERQAYSANSLTFFEDLKQHIANIIRPEPATQPAVQDQSIMGRVKKTKQVNPQLSYAEATQKNKESKKLLSKMLVISPVAFACGFLINLLLSIVSKSETIGGDIGSYIFFTLLFAIVPFAFACFSLKTSCQAPVRKKILRTLANITAVTEAILFSMIGIAMLAQTAFSFGVAFLTVVAISITTTVIMKKAKNI